MSDRYPFGKLTLANAHQIASRANSLLMALQEYNEEKIDDDPKAARFVRKGVDLGDALLDAARLLVSRGAFSKEKHMSEILIYSAAIIDGCEVCALTHIDGAVRAGAPSTVIDAVQAIALYVRAQAQDDTYLLFDAYVKYWQRFADWPRLPDGKVSNLKFYNLIALLMSLVVRKQRLVRLHSCELLTKTDVTPADLLEIIGIAQIMGGFPARWEAVHIRDVIDELHTEGKLSADFTAVLEMIPKPAGS